MAEDKVQKCMDLIQEFYFGEGEDTGEVMFKKFAQKHADKFKKSPDIPYDEHKLEYTDVYNEFQSLFEGKIEELIEKSGATTEEFIDVIKEKSKNDEEVKMFLEILISVSDYTTFSEMMEEFAEDIGKEDSD